MAQVAVAADPYPARLTRVTLTWVLVALVLFPVLALGFLMRVLQAGYLPTVPPEQFYAVMTLHGLGMVGLWFVAGMAGISILLATYVRPTIGVSWLAFVATLAGVVLLLAATLVGQFGVGWYFLYPLPFHSGGTWPVWATDAFFISLAVMGVGWTIWARRLDDLVREARGEFVASYPLPGRVRFRCVQFDEATGRVRLDWGVLLLLVPVVACTIVTTAMFRAGRSRRTSTPNTDSQLAL